MTAKRDEELTQEFTEWMALGIEHDAHVFAWLQASSSRVLEYLRKESEHAKLARTPDELTIYNMGWELSDKDDEIAQLKAQLDLRPTAAVPLEATPLSSPQDEKVSIPAIVVTSTAQALEAPASVPTAGDAPAPLTTGDIAHSFDGLRWSESAWKKPLGDKPKWLSACVTIPGNRGVSETRWNPVLIGGALVEKKYVNARNVRAKFQTVDLLKPWLEAWKTYEAEYCDNK